MPKCMEACVFVSKTHGQSEMDRFQEALEIRRRNLNQLLGS